MPSPSKPRVLMFGDSHLAAAARAVKQADQMDRFEFWGAPGPAFRTLRVTEDGVAPRNTDGAQQVAMVNGRGRETLKPGDFDVAIVVGARLRSADFLVPLAYHTMSDNGALSSQVLDACAAKWVDTRAMGVIKYLFPQGGKIAFIEAPLPLKRPQLAEHNQRSAVSIDRLRLLRSHATAAMTREGYHLVQQPEHSITDCLFTSEEHGAFDDTRDFTHITPELMKVMVNEALTLVDQPEL